jgi:opacity protein-like surface antigen
MDMGKSRALLLAALIAAGVSSSAAAADLLPPPPPVEPPPPPPLLFNGWYLRGDVGVGLNQINDFRSNLLPVNAAGGVAPPLGLVSQSLGDSPLIGIGLGYQVNNWFRVDITGEYRGSASYRAVETYSLGCTTPSGICFDSYSANIPQAIFMGNAYIDLGSWRGITPYVGGGVGLAYHRFSSLTDVGLGQGFAPDTTRDTFAWAVMAGVAYSITPNLKIDLGYRYIDMGRLTSGPIACTDLAGCFFETQSFRKVSHDIRLGFRYVFADLLPPPPPPLVTKY